MMHSHINCRIALIDVQLENKLYKASIIKFKLGEGLIYYDGWSSNGMTDCNNPRLTLLNTNTSSGD